MKDKIQGAVRAGISKVPAPIVGAMKSRVVLMGCGVLGAALTAYSSGECTGEQAITGVAIGAITIAGRLGGSFVFGLLVKGDK